MTEGSSCDHIDVIANNNILFQEAHKALSLLPAFLFDGIRAPFIMNPTTLTLFEDDSKGTADCSTELNGNTYCFAEVTLQEPSPKRDPYWFTRFLAIHEFFHIWSNEQYAKNSAMYQEYVSLVSCGNTCSGTDQYRQRFTPVTGYAEVPQATDYSEDFADSAAWYVMVPCGLQKRSRARYDFFKDKMFGGEEYARESGCQ